MLKEKIEKYIESKKYPIIIIFNEDVDNKNIDIEMFTLPIKLRNSGLGTRIVENIIKLVDEYDYSITLQKNNNYISNNLDFWFKHMNFKPCINNKNVLKRSPKNNLYKQDFN